MKNKIKLNLKCFKYTNLIKFITNKNPVFPKPSELVENLVEELSTISHSATIKQSLYLQKNELLYVFDNEHRFSLGEHLLLNDLYNVQVLSLNEKYTLLLLLDKVKIPDNTKLIFQKPKEMANTDQIISTDIVDYNNNTNLALGFLVYIILI